MLRIRLYDGQIIFLGFNWMRRAQESFQWRLFVNTVNKFQFHKVEELLGQVSDC